MTEKNIILLLLFFKDFLFFMWIVFEVFIQRVTILFLFCCFGWEAYGILAPRQGMESAPPALEGEVPNTGPPGKSQEKNLNF